MDEVLLSPEELKARHSVIKIYFLAKVRSIIEEETGEKLEGEHLSFVSQSVNQYLINQRFSLND